MSFFFCVSLCVANDFLAYLHWLFVNKKQKRNYCTAQVEYRFSNYSFQTHQHILSLLDRVVSVCVKFDCQKQQIHFLTWALERRWASGYWNFTFFYYIFSKKGRFLSFEKEKCNITFGPPYKNSFRHPRYLRVHFLHFAKVTSFMVLVVSICHIISCFILFAIRLFSLFCLMVLLYSV